MGSKAELHTLTLEGIEARLSFFEHKYGVPSSRLAEVFRRGDELEESEDFFEWSSLYRAHELVTARLQQGKD
jgi:hypothetical protein